MKRATAVLMLAFATTLFAASNATPPKFVCSLTKKKISSCCCTKTDDGKLYCTLAKKPVASCCCKAVKTR
jgi:hypothetical protein